MSHDAPANPAAPSAPVTYGLLAEFRDVDALLQAARGVRDAGYRRWDCFSPFPIHGMEEAMGRCKTILPWLVLGGGLTGLVAGLVLVWWTNALAGPAPLASLQGYPYVISGKPSFSLPANIPVIFEMTILLAGVTAVVGMLLLNALPQLHHPLFNSPRFRRVTDDGFFLAIEASDPRYDPAATARLLESLGASAVEKVEE